MTGGRSYRTRDFDPIHFSTDTDTLSLRHYFDSWRGDGYLQPEKRLMFAVLQDAVDCFQNHKFEHRSKAASQFLDTEGWIFRDDHEWPYSFVNICEAVGMDPDCLRKGLLRWKERALWNEQLQVKDNQTGMAQGRAAKARNFSGPQVKTTYGR
jgi:hypothetical protein